jgi:shikimate dehydrogenase
MSDETEAVAFERVSAARGCSVTAMVLETAAGHSRLGSKRMITGRTRLIVHLGYPTESFKAPMIYNPWFEMKGIEAVVVPVGVEPRNYAEVLKALFHTTNVHGALVTMPHKVTTTHLVDEMTTTAKIAGACNAILRRADGSLLGDMFDGAGFVRGVERKGRRIDGSGALVVGCGGVGSAIAASLAEAGLSAIGLFDAATANAEALGDRLRLYYSSLQISTGSNDPAGYDIVVNATPLGMKPGDPLPVDISRIAPNTFVGEVVMKEEFTPLLRAAMEKGCPVQVGTDMLFEMIPAYLEFFGFGTSTPEELRGVAQLKY